MCEIITPLLSLALGSAVTWLVAWYYYKRAGDDLRDEAKSLQDATCAILYFLEHPNASVEVQRTENGRVTGLIVHASGSASLKWSVRGNLTAAEDPESRVPDDTEQSNDQEPGEPNGA